MSIVQSNPSRPDTGIDLNAIAHAEYRERLINEPLSGPIMDTEPMLPLWAIAFACGLAVFFLAQLGRALL